jgi:hypothetical protein
MGSHTHWVAPSALVDVSTRPHSAPDDGERTLVLGLARDVAHRLATLIRSGPLVIDARTRDQFPFRPSS